MDEQQYKTLFGCSPTPNRPMGNGTFVNGDTEGMLKFFKKHINPNEPNKSIATQRELIAKYEVKHLRYCRIRNEPLYFEFVDFVRKFPDADKYDEIYYIEMPRNPEMQAQMRFCSIFDPIFSDDPEYRCADPAIAAFDFRIEFKGLDFGLKRSGYKFLAKVGYYIETFKGTHDIAGGLS